MSNAKANHSSKNIRPKRLEISRNSHVFPFSCHIFSLQRHTNIECFRFFHAYRGHCESSSGSKGGKLTCVGVSRGNEPIFHRPSNRCLVFFHSKKRQFMTHTNTSLYGLLIHLISEIDIILSYFGIFSKQVNTFLPNLIEIFCWINDSIYKSTLPLNDGNALAAGKINC